MGAETLDTFGFTLDDASLALSVDLPSGRDPADPLYVDMEVLAGSQAVGSPIPEPASPVLWLALCAAGLNVRRWRRS